MFVCLIVFIFDIFFKIHWQRSLPTVPWSKFIAFAELFGEANVMVFDLERPFKSGLSFAVLEGNAYDSTEYWLTASRSYHEWLNHLVTAQGDKYWTWK